MTGDPAPQRARVESAGALDLLVCVGELSRRTLEGALAAGLAPGIAHHVANSAEAALLGSGLAKPGDIVLVKGSRATQMERVSEALVARFGDGNA